MLTRNKPMSRGKLPDRPARPDRSDEFASYRAPKTTAVMATPASFAAQVKAPAAPPPKLPRAVRTDQRIRDSARGEECTVRIVGACTHDPKHTIWSHAPLQAAGKGKSIKAVDLAGAYCCTACDAVIDGQRPLPAGATRDSVMLDWFHGHMRSLVILKQKGLV